MKFLNKNLKVIIAFILGLILAGGIVYAATSADKVSYTRQGTNIETVEGALNDLYGKINNSGFNFNTIPLSAHSLYQKEYEVENGKYYIFCTLTPTDQVTVTGANKLATNLFIWSYNSQSNKIYLGVIKATSTTVTFSEKATIALLGTE